MTIIEGIDEHDIDIKELTKTLKAKCACGGTAKNGQIELQGDHKVKVKEVLSDLGFSSDTIEIRESKKNNKKEKEVFLYNDKYVDELIKKYLLWIEQGCICIYTGKPIGISNLFDGSNIVDIEHTLPRSQTFDDSLENQTLSYAYINREVKQNLLPMFHTILKLL